MKNSVLRAAGLRLVLTFVVLAGLLFLPAGSFSYWQAWLYCAITCASLFFITLYFLKRNPAFLERRMKMNEKEQVQKSLMKGVYALVLLALIVSGLDYRFGWSKVSWELSIAALAVVLLGYLLVFLVFKENEYAACTVEVEKGQKVVSTGPYAVVRHPMYAGALTMLSASPIALGSSLSLLFAPPVILLFALRALKEEEVLKRGLKGYAQYCSKVRWRLLPCVW